MLKHLLKSISALAALAAIMAPAAALAQDKFTFMFPVKSVLQYHPFYIAQELGYYKQEGLDVRFEASNGSGAALRQLIAGNVDAALPSPAAYLNAVAQGHDLRWIFSYEYANVFTLIVPDKSPIKSVADLKGKSVGVSELSGGEVPLVRAVLRGAGLEDGKDVKIVPVGEGSALTIQALQSGGSTPIRQASSILRASRRRGLPSGSSCPRMRRSIRPTAWSRRRPTSRRNATR